jgi:FtsZ-binding cell division protein ZapB
VLEALRPRLDGGTKRIVKQGEKKFQEQTQGKYLDGGTKRIVKQGEKKFQEHECEILKKTLHLLKREFEELQESKWKLKRECEKLQESKRKLERECGELLQETKRKLEQGNSSCLYELEQKLLKFNCQLIEFNRRLKEIECQLEIIDRQLEKIEPQQQELEFLFRIAYFSSLLEWLLTLCAVEDSHQGGLRNLILDGWWLEFWEIILLAAGDVERNPGPRQITDEELAKVSDTTIGK